MTHFKTLREAYGICDAVGSPVRLEILELVLEHRSMNLDALAKILHLTNGALTRHIKKLEDAGLLRVRLMPGKRGYQKQCTLRVDKILIDVASDLSPEASAAEDIPIGLYSDYAVQGLCGIVSQEGFIGTRDDKTAFLSPRRAKAAALWLQKGFVSYHLPLRADYERNIRELRLSFELSPDIRGGNASAGTVSFRLDDTDLGKIKLYPPTEQRRGFTTPAWHDSSLPQYGVLKLLRITARGTFMDGEKISSVTPKDAASAKRFSIETETGFTLFGSGFGDYNQAIRCVVQTE